MTPQKRFYDHHRRFPYFPRQLGYRRESPVAVTPAAVRLNRGIDELCGCTNRTFELTSAQCECRRIDRTRLADQHSLWA